MEPKDQSIEGLRQRAATAMRDNQKYVYVDPATLLALLLTYDATVARNPEIGAIIERLTPEVEIRRRRWCVTLSPSLLLKSGKRGNKEGKRTPLLA
jgi:hypothetical protein